MLIMPVVFKREEDRVFARAVARLNAANPFMPARIECERAALGPEFQSKGCEWNKLRPQPELHPHHVALISRAESILTAARAEWTTVGASGKEWREDVALYEELAGFWLYQTYAPRFDAVIDDALGENKDGGKLDFFAAWRGDAERWLGLPGLKLLEREPPAHLFACVFQIRRAFHHVFRGLVGGSLPMARLRAAIWQSIFTHDLGRYRRGLYARMDDFATLVTGPSGTGKELVARAVALSRFRAYDPRRQCLADENAELFYPLNLSALSPTLIESELFGHRRGAFTGAATDREGWMEVCPASGAVFLDEIGEVEGGIQVKLLRVLQARTFQRLGDTEARPFRGKIIAATNRDLAAEMRAGRFREDFYYRLCSDLIETPTLRAQLDDTPDELVVLVRHIAERLLGAEEGEAFAAEALGWIERHLGAAYAWPGNFRELEQCLRNLLVRGDYRPAGQVQASALDWHSLMQPGTLTAEEMLRHYTRHVFGLESANLQATARRLNLDRRTVQSKLVTGQGDAS
jgi:transcriptional regulator with AAA-type ATPase domain